MSSSSLSLSPSPSSQTKSIRADGYDYNQDDTVSDDEGVVSQAPTPQRASLRRENIQTQVSFRTNAAASNLHLTPTAEAAKKVATQMIDTLLRTQVEKLAQSIREQRVNRPPPIRLVDLNNKPFPMIGQKDARDDSFDTMIAEHPALSECEVQTLGIASPTATSPTATSLQTELGVCTPHLKISRSTSQSPITSWKSLIDFTTTLRNTQITVPPTELKSNLKGVAAPQNTIVSVLTTQDSGETTSQSAQASQVMLHMNTVSYPGSTNPDHAVENRIGQTAGTAHSIQNALLAALNQQGNIHSIYSFYNPLRDFPSRGDFAQVLELVNQSSSSVGNQGTKPKLNIEGFDLESYANISTGDQSVRSIKLWFKVPGSDTEMRSIVLTEFTKPASFTQALSKEELKNYRSTLKNMSKQDNLTFVSKAGIGRSAALSIFHQLANLIESGAIKDKTKLEEAFYAHIGQGRKDRGVRFLDVTAQQGSIKAALLEMLESQPNAKLNAQPKED